MIENRILEVVIIVAAFGPPIAFLAYLIKRFNR